MPHRGASSLAEQSSPGSACPASTLCQQKQYAFAACVYWFSMPFARLATVSGNERKNCIVKSGKDTDCYHTSFWLQPYELLTAIIRTFDCYHTNFWLLSYDHDTILLMPPLILNDTITLSLLGLHQARLTGTHETADAAQRKRIPQKRDKQRKQTIMPYEYT